MTKRTTTPTIDLPRSKVRSIRPDKETGEIIERVIPHRDFRPRPPRRPKLDPAFDCWPRHRQVIAMFAQREGEIAYWQFFSNHLTIDEQRHLTQDGENNSILRPIPPQWKPGDRMYVAKDMEAEVIEVVQGPRGFGTVFTTHDYRVLYMKAGVVGGGGRPQTDENGYPRELTDDEKEKARIESAYTGSASQSIDEGGAIVTEAEYRRIHGDPSEVTTRQQGRARVQLSRTRLLRRLDEARAKNRRSTVRYLERQLEHLEPKGAA